MPVYLEAARRLSSRLGDRVAVRGTGTGPLSLAAYLLGPQNLLMKLAEMSCGMASAEDERGFETLMEVVSETAIAFLKAQVDAGVQLVYLGDSLASCDMISPPMYRRYVLPYHRRVFDGVREECRRRGAHTLLHVCGDNTAILKDLAATGAVVYEVDSRIDLQVALHTIGDETCLIGNLDPAGLLLGGSPADVRRESEKCLAAASPEGGFILGTGCFVPWDTPLENLQEMVRASRE
jgi:uroporphyrinogen decarboxylase